MFALLIGVPAAMVIGWKVARGRGEQRWFTVTAALGLMVNVVVAILAEMWTSGNL